MTASASGGTVPHKWPVRLSLLGLIITVGAFLLALSANGASAAPTVISTVGVGAYPHGVGVNAATDRVYVANTNDNNVSVIKGTTNAVVATVPVGEGPADVAVNAATNRIYVANSNDNTLSVIDGSTDPPTVIETVPVGTAPTAVAVNATINRVYVANFDSDNVSVIAVSVPAGTHHVVDTVAVGDGPSGIAVNEGLNLVYVTNAEGDSVSLIDGSDNTFMGNTTVGIRPVGIAVNEATDLVYVANSDNLIVDVLDPGASIVDTVDLDTPPIGVAVNSQTNRVYVTHINGNNVSIVNGATKAFTTVAVGEGPYGVGVNETTSRAYVANSGTNNVSVIGEPAPPPLPDPSKYCIDGTSKGTLFTWTFTIQAPVSGTVPAGTVPPGGTASQIVDAFVGSINNASPGAASQGPGLEPECFETHGTGLAVNDCLITTSGCTFNPTIYLVPPVGGVADLFVAGDSDSSDFSAPYGYSAIAGAAVLLAAGLWYGRRRWMR